jgi:D-sedoheptulose 7-phosphate isomerase
VLDIPSVLAEHQSTISALEPLIPQIEMVGQRMLACLRSGGKVLWMGNGGSAADSQHLAAELVGRYSRERLGLPSIALTTNTSILTAVGNDYDFESIFARQIQALCNDNDLVVGISTSGQSINVLRGIESARRIGAFTVGFCGGSGGPLAQTADVALIVPSQVTARIQEAHILIGHIICEWLDTQLAEETA